MINWIKDNIGGFWNKYPFLTIGIFASIVMVTLIAAAVRSQMNKANMFHDTIIKVEWIDYEKKVVVGEVNSRREIITGVIDFGRNIPFVGETWKLNQNGVFLEFNERLK